MIKGTMTDYKDARRGFLAARRKRAAIDKGAMGSWTAWRRLEVEYLHEAIGLRTHLGLSTANPDRFVIP